MGVTMRIDEQATLALGQRVLNMEASSITQASQCLDRAFVRACEQLICCQGHVVLMGIGKSGHIARKIAATLSSTGTPAFFLHPSEAAHGDLGTLTSKDVVVFLSQSGVTEEIQRLLPALKQLGVVIIALTGNAHATLAKAADIHVSVAVAQEACHLGLAPTSSTAVAMAMGDALAIVVSKNRGFTKKAFAKSHPGGALGKNAAKELS